jgi:hypothetical protein
VVTIRIEDAFAEKRPKGLETVADTIVLELDGQDGFDVLWLDGYDCASLQLLYCECGAVDAKELASPFEDFVLAESADGPGDCVETQEGLLVGGSRYWLAAMAEGELAADDESPDRDIG